MNKSKKDMKQEARQYIELMHRYAAKLKENDLLKIEYETLDKELSNFAAFIKAIGYEDPHKFLTSSRQDIVESGERLGELRRQALVFSERERIRKRVMELYEGGRR